MSESMDRRRFLFIFGIVLVSSLALGVLLGFDLGCDGDITKTGALSWSCTVYNVTNVCEFEGKKYLPTNDFNLTFNLG